MDVLEAVELCGSPGMWTEEVVNGVYRLLQVLHDSGELPSKLRS